MSAVLAAFAVALLCAAAPASAAPTRYSLQGGCWALHSATAPQAVPGAERLRLQATRLGSYLLYTPDAKFLAVQGDHQSVAPADKPSPAADWRVDDAGDGSFTLSPASDPQRVLSYSGGHLTIATRDASGTESQFSFLAADGCPVYPEAELDAQGTPSGGSTPYGAVGGLLEGHMHWMTYEYLGGNFHCGKPWDPYGIPFALPDCSSVEGPEGSAAPVQNFLNFGAPEFPHDTTGWPKLTEWGNHNLTYEGTYWRWIQRAWMGGLRLMVMSVNENRVLCELMANRKTNCDEMDTVRRGFRDMRDLQNYVDAQAGGPGKGFFQIVTTPEQARQVINEGKMAVVLEIEVSELFGCRGWETSTCDKPQIDRELDEMYRLGVRSSLLLNKFDNPLTGVRFDSGPVGVLINGGNHQSAGSFWSAETCKGPFHDNTIESGSPQASAVLANALATVGVTGGTVPAYPPAPHCNTRGLTELGRYVERQMMARHMIINPDHMSQKAVDDTLTLLEANHYSGVISPHGWMDPGNWPRIWKLGGLAFPNAQGSQQYVDAYKKYRPQRTPYLLGWGYGADLGGLAQQPSARDGGVSYPFKSYDGSVTFQRQRTGDRTFDYNKDGVAHYGLYADWYHDVQQLGGPAMARDMWNGAEAYLEMWERADGIRAPGCSAGPLRAGVSGLGPIRLGASWEQLLRTAGQPQQRTRAWSWCVGGVAGAGGAADVAELSPGGLVELAGSTARGRSAGGVGVGASAARARRGASSVGGGVLVRRTRSATYVYKLRGRRVGAVAVASRSLRGGALRGAMGRLASASASQAPRGFVPNATPESQQITGSNLVGTGNDGRLNSALALLCGLSH
jgi:hypothetical protein